LTEDYDDEFSDEDSGAECEFPDVRKAFQEKLGRNITNERWAAIVQGNYSGVEDADGDPKELDALVTWFQKITQSGKRILEEPSAPTYVASPEETAAGEALSAFFQQQLNELPKVKKFRSRLPNGKPLSVQDAHLFYRSPLTTLFSFDDIATMGVAATDREWRVMDIPHLSAYRYVMKIGKPTLFICVWRDPSALLQVYPYATDGFVSGAVHNFTSRWDVIAPSKEDEDIERLARNRRLFNIGFFDGRSLPVSGDSFESFGDPFGFKGSAMGDALQITWEISRSYGMPVHRALDFLVQDSAPLPQPITSSLITRPIYDANGNVDYAAYAGIKITAQAWISPKSVENHYREFQELIFSPDSRQRTSDNSQGNLNRVSATKQTRRRARRDDTMTVVKFVMEEREQDASLTWPRLANMYHSQTGISIAHATMQKRYSRGIKSIREMLPEFGGSTWSWKDMESKRKAAMSESDRNA